MVRKMHDMWHTNSEIRDHCRKASKAYGKALVEHGFIPDSRVILLQAIDATSGFDRARRIVALIAEANRIPYRDMVSPRRDRGPVRARQHAMWELRRLKDPELTLPQIGRQLGGRDHTTILYGLKVHQKLVDAGEFNRE